MICTTRYHTRLLTVDFIIYEFFVTNHFQCFEWLGTQIHLTALFWREKKALPIRICFEESDDSLSNEFFFCIAYISTFKAHWGRIFSKGIFEFLSTGDFTNFFHGKFFTCIGIKNREITCGKKNSICDFRKDSTSICKDKV